MATITDIENLAGSINNLAGNLSGSVQNLTDNQVSNFENLQKNDESLQTQIDTNKATLVVHEGLVSQNTEDIETNKTKIAENTNQIKITARDIKDCKMGFCGQTLILTKNGLVYGFGNNRNINLFNSEDDIALLNLLKEEKNIPIISNKTKKAISISAGHNTSSIVYDDNTLEIFGVLKEQVIADPDNLSNVKKCECAENFVMILKTDGELISVGTDNSSNQLIPDTVVSVKDYILEDFETKIVDIACGFKHTVLLLENQRVLSFGDNELGQCGQGTEQKSYTLPEAKLLELGHEVIYDASFQLGNNILKNYYNPVHNLKKYATNDLKVVEIQAHGYNSLFKFTNDGYKIIGSNYFGQATGFSPGAYGTGKNANDEDITLIIGNTPETIGDNILYVQTGIYKGKNNDIIFPYKNKYPSSVPNPVSIIDYCRLGLNILFIKNVPIDTANADLINNNYIYYVPITKSIPQMTIFGNANYDQAFIHGLPGNPGPVELLRPIEPNTLFNKTSLPFRKWADRNWDGNAFDYFKIGTINQFQQETSESGAYLQKGSNLKFSNGILDPIRPFPDPEYRKLINVNVKVPIKDGNRVELVDYNNLNSGTKNKVITEFTLDIETTININYDSLEIDDLPSKQYELQVYEGYIDLPINEPVSIRHHVSNFLFNPEDIEEKSKNYDPKQKDPEKGTFNLIIPLLRTRYKHTGLGLYTTFNHISDFFNQQYLITIIIDEDDVYAYFFRDPPVAIDTNINQRSHLRYLDNEKDYKINNIFAGSFNTLVCLNNTQILYYGLQTYNRTKINYKDIEIEIAMQDSSALKNIAPNNFDSRAIYSELNYNNPKIFEKYFTILTGSTINGLCTLLDPGSLSALANSTYKNFPLQEIGLISPFEIKRNRHIFDTLNIQHYNEYGFIYSSDEYSPVSERKWIIALFQYTSDVITAANFKSLTWYKINSVNLKKWVEIENWLIENNYNLENEDQLYQITNALNENQLIVKNIVVPYGTIKFSYDYKIYALPLNLDLNEKKPFDFLIPYTKLNEKLYYEDSDIVPNQEDLENWGFFPNLYKYTESGVIYAKTNLEISVNTGLYLILEYANEFYKDTNFSTTIDDIIAAGYLEYAPSTKLLKGWGWASNLYKWTEAGIEDAETYGLSDITPGDFVTEEQSYPYYKNYTNTDVVETEGYWKLGFLPFYKALKDIPNTPIISEDWLSDTQVEAISGALDFLIAGEFLEKYSIPSYKALKDIPNTSITGGDWVSDTKVEAISGALDFLIAGEFLEKYSIPSYKALKDIPNTSITGGDWVSDTKVEAISGALDFLIAEGFLEKYSIPVHIIDP